jgi:hypothetical protein
MSLKEIIQAIVNRDGSGGGESLIVANHLAQLKMFGARGIEVYPVQDPTGERKKLISSIWHNNRFDLYLDYIWDLYLSCGEICFYLRPTNNTYEISWFHGGISDPDPEFKAYYKPGGRELEKVVIAYPYKVQSAIGMEESRWVKLDITKDKIERRDMNQKPDLKGLVNHIGANLEVVDNTLGFIPCVVVPNHPTRPGQPGTSEFHWLQKPLERHDDMLTTINRNLSLFANPTLVTTRSRGEVLEAAGSVRHIPNIVNQSGFYPSSYKSDPRERFLWEGGERVATILGGVGADERVGYIQCDPVSGDQNLYQREYREQLHTALGGTDPLGIRSGATAYEVKIKSGQTAATARKKCLALYDYGVCKLFEMVIMAEEQLFKQSLFVKLKESKSKDFKKLEYPEQLRDEFIQQMAEAGKIPPGVMGMIPSGDRTLEWRFTAEIFPDTSREILDKSIVGRNLAEAGINTEHVLRFLFPDKTEKEIAKMQSGNFSYRTTQNKVAAINQLIGLFGQMLNVPDPSDPSLPLGASMGAPVVELIDQALYLLSQEFSYGQKYDPVDETSYPQQQNPFSSQQYQPTQEQNVNGRSSTTNPSLYKPDDARGSIAAAGIPTEFPGFGASYEPTTGYPRSKADFSNPLPAPGGTVTGRVYANGGTGYQRPNPVPGLPADISVSPELWSIFQQQQSSDRTSSRTKSKSKSKSKR